MVKEENQKTESDNIKKLICQLCLKEVDPYDWNPYYQAHEKCVNNSGRIG